MGQVLCPGEHEYVDKDLGAGVARLQCTNCDSVVIDLDAAKDGVATVTVPGLFGPSKPTIFSVLGAERRAELATAEGSAGGEARHGPRFAFQGGAGR